MLMLDAPLFWSDEVTDFSCWAVAFIVNAGRLATATMPVLRTRNLRRDIAPRTILFGSFMMILRVMLPGHSRVVFDGKTAASPDSYRRRRLSLQLSRSILSVVHVRCISPAERSMSGDKLGLRMPYPWRSPMAQCLPPLGFYFV